MNPVHLSLFTWEFVQHEALHHGQWSIYASLSRVRHAVQLARVVGLVKIDTIDPTYYTVD